jgi:ABC-2 type transport system permease protein
MFMLRLFGKIVKYKFYAQIEYPGSYLLGIIAQISGYGIEMAMIFLTVWRFGTLAGWLPPEVVFMFAAWLLSYAVGASFTFNICMGLRDYAVNGTLDEAFIRPVKPFFYLIATNYNLGYIAHIVVASAALAVSVVQLAVSWNFFQWLWLFITIIAGAVICGCMMLILEFPALKTRSRSPVGVLYWGLWEVHRYPITVFPRAIQFIFTAVLPYAFISFYPTQVLLGKQDGLFAPVSLWLSPAVAVLLLGLTALCWKMASRNYESAGT